MSELDRIKDLRAKQDALLAKLERSLALQSLWPEVFAAGKVTSCWIGAPRSRSISGGIRYALRLRVETAAGETREFAQADVPAALWPCAEIGRLP